jgi:hypothetical protein
MAVHSQDQSATAWSWDKSGAWYLTLNKVFQFKVSAVGPTSSWPWTYFSAMTVYEACLNLHIPR